MQMAVELAEDKILEAAEVSDVFHCVTPHM